MVETAVMVRIIPTVASARQAIIVFAFETFSGGDDGFRGLIDESDCEPRQHNVFD